MADKTLQQNFKAAKQHLEESRVHFEAKRFDEAITSLKVVLNFELSSQLITSTTYYMLGTLSFLKGDYESAIESCKESIKQNPKDATTYLLLSVSYRRIGESKKAEENFKKGRRILWGRDDWFENKIEGLDEKIQDILENVCDAVLLIQESLAYDWPNEDGGLVTHYTSRDALKEYLGKPKGRFHLYSSDAMNDRNEGKEIFTLLKDPKLVNLEKIIDEEKSSEDKSVAYIGSFISGKGAEDQLSHWRTYGKEASGASLSFARDSFSKKEDFSATTLSTTTTTLNESVSRLSKDVSNSEKQSSQSTFIKKQMLYKVFYKGAEKDPKLKKGLERVSKIPKETF